MATESRSLFEALQRFARETPRVIAAIDTIDIVSNANVNVPCQMTYFDLCNGAERLATALAREFVENTVPTAVATWMKRGNKWYLCFCAALKLQIPLVALSSDLPDQEIEVKRNAEIIEGHNISFLVVDRVWNGCALRTMDFHELWIRALDVCLVSHHFTDPDLDATLCFCYTGGTTKASRCARITHRMALHELDAYPKITRLGPEDRVLQQHSLYWGASAYGEIDIALAFGCALVFCEAWDTDAVTSAIQVHRATCAGLVPSMLAAIDPADVPDLRLVFTWGEALQTKVARDWAFHVQLLDLLISTECWLSLYADWSDHVRCSNHLARSRNAELQSPPFKTVPGTVVRLRPLGDTGRTSAGELLVSGPMVSPGYTDPALNADAFELDAIGAKWYGTKDCLEPYGDNGFKFAGRADDLIKVGGKWIDTRELEQCVLAVDGVAEIFISSRDVFIVAKSLHDGTIQRIRKSLPPDFVLYVVSQLPRKTGTGKVDRQTLGEMVSMEPLIDRVEKETARCLQELSSLVRWYRVFLLLLVSSIWFALDTAVLYRDDAAFLDVFVTGLTFSLKVAFSFFSRILFLSYMLLSVWHLPSETLRWVRTFPAGSYGLAVFISIIAPSPIWCAPFAAHGICLATLRGRLLSWPLVALMGIPFWLRGTGIWMWDYGLWGTVEWYFMLLFDPVKEMLDEIWKKTKAWLAFHFFLVGGPLRPLFSEIVWRVRVCCGLTRKCTWCKSLVASSAGRMQPSVDKFWYCNTCWQRFDNHVQCSACLVWSIKAKMVSQGFGPNGQELWACRKCGPSLKSGDGRPREDMVKKRTIVLPELPIVTLTNGHKRRTANVDGEIEISTPVRRRTSEMSSVNGTQVSREHQESQEQSSLGEEDQAVAKKRSAMSLSPLEAKRFKLEDELCSGEVLTNCKFDTRSEDPMVTSEHPASLQKSKNWTILERATGLTFDSRGESLLSLDSLHHTKLTSALRRQSRKRVSKEILKRCTSLGDLLDAIDHLPEEESKQCTQPMQPCCEEGHAIWGMMWQSKCQWIFHRNRPLRESVMRSALASLAERHDAFRTNLRDPYVLFVATQNALTVFELFRRYTACFLQAFFIGRLILRCMAPLGVALERAACWSFLRAWPRVSTHRTNGAGALPLTVTARAETLEDAHSMARRSGFGFRPPFSATLVPYGQGAEEGALVRIGISHMLSDGYCVVPILDDFAYFVAQAEAAAEHTNGRHEAFEKLSRHHLPPVPSAFAALESRIAQTVAGAGYGSSCLAGGGGAVGDHGITREFFGRKLWHNAFTFFAMLPEDVVVAIRKAACKLAVPADIALLTLIGITLARFEDKRRTLIAMIVPQRDGSGENDMVGLFADVRHLVVATDGLNIAGVALRLHHIVKERLWCAPGIATQFDMTVVNFEWTDFDERQGFTQTVELSQSWETSFHPLRIAVDQPNKDAWRMRVAFNKSQYNEDQRNSFFDIFETTFHSLVRDPLELVWPVGS